jgi:hypothetical protein
MTTKKNDYLRMSVNKLPYFPALKMHWPIRPIMIFSLEILETRKNNDECILFDVGVTVHHRYYVR